MKNLSIRTKITLWFSAVIILITAVMFTVILLISSSAIYTDVKDTLKNTVSTNTQEIEFISDDSETEREAGDQYIEYKNGMLEIDDDFLNETGGVYCALYTESGNLLYGQNIISAPVNRNENINKIRYNNENYYYINIALSGKNLEGLILQGIINEDANETVLTRIVNLSLLILPILALEAIIGGYFLSGKLLAPIRKITQSGEEISDGNDLSKRIPLGKSKDELYTLSDTFNKMFSRLEKSFEEERQFTSDISHELRTPVSAILAQSELTLEKERSADEYVRSLSVIKRQSMRMKYIVDEMLQFSRLEKLQYLPKKEKVNLSHLMNEITEEQQAISINNIQIYSDIQQNVIIYGNENMLASMINSLISNAYRYGKENGTTYVTLKGDENTAVITVKDNGIGISEDIKDKIFRRFFRADDVRNQSDASYGIGLGLPMAAEIARLHNGKNTVDSTLGKGSIFTVKIKIK